MHIISGERHHDTFQQQHYGTPKETNVFLKTRILVFVMLLECLDFCFIFSKEQYYNHDLLKTNSMKFYLLEENN